MTRLLISVRSATEAQLALESGADLIDVKEPSRGSLGAADVNVVEAVARQVAGRATLSVALGELLSESVLAGRLAAGFRYAKFGLAGCAMHADWPSRWRRAAEQLPAATAPVAVAYADWTTAAAPDPWTVVGQAAKSRCGAVLFDTHDKSRGSLLGHLALRELGRLIDAVRADGLVCVVAGGLGRAEIAKLLPLAPDYVAVRGAACAGDRTGTLDRARIRLLAALLANGQRQNWRNDAAHNRPRSTPHKNA